MRIDDVLWWVVLVRYFVCAWFWRVWAGMICDISDVYGVIVEC